MANLEYSDGEMHEILKRAAAIDGNANLSRHVLEQTAAELGISPQALLQAEEEFRKETAQKSEIAAFLQARRVEFGQHLASYLTVNAFLVGVWWMTGARYPWFIWPLLGWGIGIFGHWVTSRATAGEDFEREFKRWRKRRAKSTPLN